TPTRDGATPGRTSTSSSTLSFLNYPQLSSRITQALEAPHLAPDTSPGSSHRHGLNTPVQPAIPIPHMVNGLAKVANDSVTVRLLCVEHGTSHDLQREVHPCWPPNPCLSRRVPHRSHRLPAAFHTRCDLPAQFQT